MNSPAKDIATILDAESGLALTFADNLHVGMEPPKPIECVTIFDTYGSSPQLAMNDQGYEMPNIQVRVRSAKYDTGWAMIEAIKDRLHGLHQEVWNSTLYSAIYCASGPVFLD